MKRTTLVAAFTLIELVVVLGIVAILATIGLSTAIGNRPKIRLTAASSEVRLALLKARTTAVRTTRNVKVCVFRDGDPMTLPAANNGRLVVFSCNTPGRAGCFGTTICTNAAAATGVQWSGTTDLGTTLVPCPGATANRWCEEPLLGLELGAAPRNEEQVSISRFLTTSNTDTTRDSIELTYTSAGSIDPQRSSNASARIELVNRELCTGSCASLADFTATPFIEYSVGGSSRMSN